MPRKNEGWMPFKDDVQNFINEHHRIAVREERERGRWTYTPHVSIEDIHATTDARHAQAPKSPLRTFLTNILHRIHPNG